ncbi:MAG: hypothetical protein K0R49_646 [Burkholderiales bacterium]|jgi:hypothetical protein|nr:hypothetical protein [Burkholderiales bacterium]
MQLDDLLDKLWQQYVSESPDSGKIHDLLLSTGENIVNDHIAFRTFDDPRINLDKLGQIFKDLGYEEKGEYQFPLKKLFARHYVHSTDETKPKIFISQLISSEFSQFLQSTVKACVDKINGNKLNSPELLYSGALWGELDYEIYNRLLSESEYAAWLYVFGFRANHFTVFLNYMRKLNTLESMNEFLKQNGFKLNTSGGEIKGTPTELLEQSSTIANEVPVRFKQGTFFVSNSYYEFARRYPSASGSLYQGFIAASADKIFESTNTIR